MNRDKGPLQGYWWGAQGWLWLGWPGLTADGAEYLSGLGVVAVGGDGAGVDAWDGTGGAPGRYAATWRPLP